MLLAPLLLATACGLTFDVPPGWRTKVVKHDAHSCSVAIDPKEWEALRRSTNWYLAPNAVTLTRFYDTTLKKAAAELGYESDDHGRWGVPGFRSMISAAEPFRLGRWSGWRSDPFNRIYARHEAKLAPNESRVASVVTTVLVLRDRGGAIVGITCEPGAPDAVVDADCAATANLLIRSLRAATPAARTP